jgi:hypothetical protein
MIVYEMAIISVDNRRISLNFFTVFTSYKALNVDYHLRNAEDLATLYLRLP